YVRGEDQELLKPEIRDDDMARVRHLAKRWDEDRYRMTLLDFLEHHGERTTYSIKQRSYRFDHIAQLLREQAARLAKVMARDPITGKETQDTLTRANIWKLLGLTSGGARTAGLYELVPDGEPAPQMDDEAKKERFLELRDQWRAERLEQGSEYRSI